jgi:L-lysine 6-oxidase
VNQLGELIEDTSGRLLVLGGFGNAGGVDPITSFGGASSWFDDISDGPVTADVYLGGCDAPITLTAWVVVGSPKFAPELVNIATLDDVMLDTAVRYLGLAPDLYDEATWPATYGWNPEYVANFSRDIEPILRRPLDYIWVANVPSMVDFATPGFDPTDTSPATAADRAAYVGYFRVPGGVFDDTPPELSPDHARLMTDDGVPMMPLNSGTNSVSNTIVDKFMSLTPTQYYLLYQWGQGRFGNDPPRPWPSLDPLDHASVGNAVGHPMCPGIEVTWSTRNPALYEAPYRIRHRHDEAWYAEHGLDPSEDETAGGRPPISSHYRSLGALSHLRRTIALACLGRRSVEPLQASPCRCRERSVDR